MRVIASRLRAVAKALTEPWGLLWLGFGGALAILGASGAVVTTYEGFEHAGIVLQMLGILTAVVGLEERRRAFGGQSILKWGKEKLRQVFGRGRSVRMSGNTAASSQASAHGNVVTGFPAHATTEEKIEILRERVNSHDKQISQLGKQNEAMVSKLRQELNSEIDQTRNEVQKLEDFVRKIEIGGIHIEIAGIIWLGVGLFCSAYPEAFYLLFKI